MHTGQPPSIPFWLGEAPARTHELSVSVSRLRERRLQRGLTLMKDGSGVNLEEAFDWLTEASRRFRNRRRSRLLIIWRARRLCWA